VRQFLGKPKWIVLTVLVVVATLAMVWAGFWQLRRLDERRDRNAVIRERAAAEAPPVSDVLSVDESVDEARTDAEWRDVEASGTYDVDAEVLIRNRSLDGAPGYHVVTPLVMAEGTALLVNRGWIPLSPEAGAAPEAPAPTPGEVTVVGRVRGSQERGALGPTDAADGTLAQLARVDVARIAQQLPYPLLPAYVELESQDPAAPQPLPRLIPAPELDEGPHLAFAVQWFIFATLAVGGWVLLVRRERQSVRASDQGTRQGERVPGGEPRPHDRGHREEDGAHHAGDPTGGERAGEVAEPLVVVQAEEGVEERRQRGAIEP
jgi:cytochrome oxidase assembly protein ShyY1